LIIISTNQTEKPVKHCFFKAKNKIWLCIQQTNYSDLFTESKQKKRKIRFLTFFKSML